MPPCNLVCRDTVTKHRYLLKRRIITDQGKLYLRIFPKLNIKIHRISSILTIPLLPNPISGKPFKPKPNNPTSRSNYPVIQY
mmetsp:Transcript_37053/g.44269  ORF Transcript_37053/g.44269 Transcript_37053/m.44269 type:complete len:82 (-) Transcript_37053:309-554(-)